MPGKTNTDAIRDLERMMAILEERVETILRDFDNLASEQRRTSETTHALDKRVTVLEAQLGEFKKGYDEADRRRWAVWLALLGSMLTVLINVLMLFLRSR